MRESAVRYFQAYGRPLDTVKSLKYLGRLLTASDDECPEVVGKLRKYWKRWALLLRIMVREGAITSLLGMLFKAVLQAVLIGGGGR